MTTGREALNLLVGRAPTPTEIAAVLLAGGFQGCQGRSRLCPVAIFLARETGLQWTIVGGVGWTEGEYVEFPQAVASFVRRFDLGEFPQLRMHDPDEDSIEEILGADHD